jgi:hypothetical protein
VFNPGSLVLLKSKVPGRRKVKAVGPYVFIKYLGPQSVVALIANKTGKTYEVSAANIIPVHDSEFNRLMKYEPPVGRGEDEYSDTSSDVTWPTSSEEELPPGVIVEPTKIHIEKLEERIIQNRRK